MPWKMRSKTSRIGAQSPILSYVGKSPMRKVAAPIMNSVRISMVFRPILSP